MANNFTLNVSENFNVDDLTAEISEQYTAKGYTIRPLKMKNGAKLTIEKGVGGINTLLGLGQGITVTFTLMGKEKDTLSVSLSDGDWTGKIIGALVGWFLCFIPIVTAIIGALRQSNFQKELTNDIQMLVSEAE